LPPGYSITDYIEQLEKNIWKTYLTR
jgi:hypothetical protein